MTDLHRAGDAGPSVRPASLLAARRRRVSMHQPAQAFAVLACGGAAMLAAAASLTDGFDDTAMLVGLGALALIAGLALFRASEFPTVPRPSSILAMVTGIWCTQVVLSTILYRATGAIERWPDAVFESMAGFTTSAFTVVEPESLSRGMLAWRAMTQWLGGYGAIVVAVAVIPFIGGTRDVEAADGQQTRAHPFAPSTTSGLRRISIVYPTFSAVMVVAYFAAGMGWFDATAHGLSTASTGGFSTRSGSIIGFESSAIEWVATFGMLLAGLNLALVWWTIRGSTGSVLRSTELRVYLAIVVAAGATFARWDGVDLDVDSARRALFTSSSLTSTTGFDVGDLSGWHPGTETVVMLLMLVGAMAGSAGGGFRVHRVITLYAFARRELSRQLHRTMVRVVKVDGRPIGDRNLARIVGYSFLYTAVIVATALAVAVTTTSELTATTTIAVAAVSTTGSTGVSSLGDWTHLVLLPAMLAGRLSITPVLDAIASVVLWSRDQVVRRWRRAARWST